MFSKVLSVIYCDSNWIWEKEEFFKKIRKFSKFYAYIFIIKMALRNFQKNCNPQV
jgi:hypothetical protein